VRRKCHIRHNLRTERAGRVAVVHRPFFIALSLGTGLTVVSALTDSPVALASLLAAVLLGAAFPGQGVLVGAAVMVPQVLGAVAVGIGESIGLTLVAVAAGLAAVGFSALLGAGGALIRHGFRSARG
jgi:hypothetical protein